MALQSVVLPFALILFIALMLEQVVRSDQLRATATRAGLLHQFMSKKHDFVGAYDESIEYNGRWLSTPDQFCKAASFGGSSFEFSVFNTTSVDLEVANTAPEAQVDYPKPKGSLPLILTAAKSSTRIEGLVSIFHSVNGSANATYHDNIDGIVTLAHNLDPNGIHTFKVTLPYCGNGSTLQFRNVWIAKGGQLLPPSPLKNEIVTTTNNDTEKKTAMLLEHSKIPERRLVEIMAPTSLLSYTCPLTSLVPNSASWAVNWPTLLQDNFLDSTFSTLEISSTSCLTSRCDKVTDKPQHTFFRSGPPNTTLHNHLWPFASMTSSPNALVLILGLSDVESLLAAQYPGKHGLISFIDELSQKYSAFIRTIRRTAYSPSSLANIRSQKSILDESHLYNSAPSTLPVLLVLPPIPSPLLVPHSRQLKSVLHHATSKVLEDLKWHIGDRKTILIDTAGWLNDSDFTPCQRPHHDEPWISASDFVLTQSGHVKFAYHLSLHLCPYLGDSECPFEKHSEYVGNLVVPEAENVGRKMEERRVEKIKELFEIK